jgi:hypothetical protein
LPNPAAAVEELQLTGFGTEALDQNYDKFVLSHLFLLSMQQLKPLFLSFLSFFSCFAGLLLQWRRR